MKRIATRSRLSLSRQLGKTLILFLVILLLGMTTSGAISISQAIRQTETNLRRQIPPVATIIQDIHSFSEYIEQNGYEPSFDWLTAQMIEEIGNLPDIRAFNYSVVGRSFFSRELNTARNAQVYQVDGIEEHINFQFDLLNRYNPIVDELEVIRLKGVSYPAVVEIEEETLTLLDGRVFTNEDMAQNHSVALISQAFSEVNNLTLGDTFFIENIFFDDLTSVELANETVELEVIGIFAPTFKLTQDSDFLEIANHVNFSSLIYVPIHVAKLSTYFALDYLHEHDMAQFIDETGRGFLYEDIIFILNDSLDLSRFVSSATEMIPNFWMMNDLTGTFSNMTASMETLQGIAYSIMIGSTMTSVFVLSLLIVLFLHDRREEIGIYLALGEKKSYVVLQIFLEIFIITTLATILSLFIGNMVAERLSQVILQNDLVANTSTDQLIQMGGWNDFNTMGFGFEMTVEEMLEAYSVSLDGLTIIIFIGVTIATTSLSIMMPMIYLVKLRPKDILMKSAIG